MDAAVKQVSVRKSVTVNAPIAHVFRTFTERQNDWWPRAHHIGKCEQFTATLEPRTGGRWFERGDDGSECVWGSVAVWDPPRRVVLIWQLDAEFEYDPALTTEVEVSFSPQEDGSTRVELEHRGLENYGDRADEMRETFGRPGGWVGLLQMFADAAAAQT